MTLICSGSLAFDRLLSVPGVFGDSLAGVSPEMFNICLLVEKIKRTYGGTAGNVAYNLDLLGEKPLIVASLGDDPDGEDYRKRLAGRGFPLDAVVTQKDHMTAGATIVTDTRDNMFNFFHPGAMNASTGFDPASLPGPVSDYLAIVSPGGSDEMMRLCRAYRSLGIKYIFDPGQQLPVFSPEQLVDMLDGSFMLICNAFEFESYKNATCLATDDLFRHTEVIIVTQGSAGSNLLVPGRGSQHVGAVPVNQVVNATGAGDAFRAGLLKGLSRGEHLITACRLGSTVAAFCVEVNGTQDQYFTPAQIMARHASAFKEQINLL